MAVDQIAIRASAAEARALERCAQGTRRARDLAAAILGTSYQGRGGLRPPCRILLHQPGETRVGGKGGRLAALVISSGRARWNFSGRLGGRRGSDRRVRRARLKDLGRLGEAVTRLARDDCSGAIR